MNILALADDTTGALETGSSFASLGLETEVWLRPAATINIPALVIDTQSRHLAPEEAADRISKVVNTFATSGQNRIFKKTDSTLRGNIPAELEALSALFPNHAIVYAPAYPALGRTVQNSRLLLNDVSVELTPFGNDIREPVRTGFLPDLFMQSKLNVLCAHDATQLSEYLARDAARALIICDGVKDDDLRAVAVSVANAKQHIIAAGPASFASFWASQIVPHCDLKSPMLQARRGLIVSASCHPASEQQIRLTEAQGMSICNRATGAVDAIRANGWAILKPPAHLSDPHQICAVLSDVVSKVATECPFEVLVLFGGDVAHSVLEKLGIDYLKSKGDIFPGIPLSFPPIPGFPAVVTKAGGFGPPTVICDILKYLGN